MKFLLKLFIPKPEKLASLAAESLQKVVNESGKNEQIAKYGSIADKATEVQKWLTEMLKDGKLDSSETSDIAAKLEPLFQKLIEAI